MVASDTSASNSWLDTLLNSSTQLLGNVINRNNRPATTTTPTDWKKYLPWVAIAAGVVLVFVFLTRK
jgi:hypothetical protein